MTLEEFKIEIVKIDKNFIVFFTPRISSIHINFKIKNQNYHIIFNDNDNVILSKYITSGLSIKEIMQDTAEKILLKIKQLDR